MGKQYTRQCPECNNTMYYVSYASWHHSENRVCWSCAGKSRTIPTKQHNKAWKGHGEIPLTYFNQIKISAIRRNIPFDITIQELWELFQKQNGKCIYSGLSLTFPEKRKLTKFSVASLDRIDSRIGYVSGNVQWVHKDINWMKMDFEQDYFVQMCNFVSENYSTELTPIDIFIKQRRELTV